MARTGRVVSAALVVVVLLGGCVLGYRAVAGELPDLNYRTVSATGEEGRLARDGLALAAFGDSDGYDYVRTFDQVLGMKFLSDAEIAVLRDGQPTAARATVSATPQGRVVAVVLKMIDRTAAGDTASKLDALQLTAGMHRAPGVTWVRRVEVTPPGQRPDGRAHWAHGNLLVRVDLTAAPGVPLGPAFTDVINRELRELPADG